MTVLRSTRFAPTKRPPAMAAVFVCGAALRKQRPPRRRFRGGFLILRRRPSGNLRSLDPDQAARF